MTKEAEAAEAKKQHAQAELAVASQELKNLRSKIEIETARLLKKRENELKSKIGPLEKKLISLADRESKLRESIQEKESELSTKNLEFSGLNDAILSKNADISSLDKQIRDKTDTVVQLDTQRWSLEAIIKGIGDEISDLETKKELLKDSIAPLESEKAELGSKIRELSAEFDSIHLEKERELSILENKLLTTQQNESLTRRVIEEESALLADRKLALDEKERVLRIREERADIQESAIQRNAKLLDL